MIPYPISVIALVVGVVVATVLILVDNERPRYIESLVLVVLSVAGLIAIVRIAERLWVT